jgi:hypothetical protein
MRQGKTIERACTEPNTFCCLGMWWGSDMVV